MSSLPVIEVKQTRWEESDASSHRMPPARRHHSRSSRLIRSSCALNVGAQNASRDEDGMINAIRHQLESGEGTLRLAGRALATALTLCGMCPDADPAPSKLLEARP